MGTSYRPVLYLGKYFEDDNEAKEFYEQFYKLSEEDQEVIEEDGFGEYMYEHEELSGTMLNYCQGYGFLLGIELSRPNPLTFADDYIKAILTWKKYFKDEPYDLIHEVRIS